MNARGRKETEAGKERSLCRGGWELPGLGGGVADGLLREGVLVSVVAALETLWADAAAVLAGQVKIEIAVGPGEGADGARGARVAFATGKGLFQRLADAMLARFERGRAVLGRGRRAGVQQRCLRHGGRTTTTTPRHGCFGNGHTLAATADVAGTRRALGQGSVPCVLCVGRCSLLAANGQGGVEEAIATCVWIGDADVASIPHQTGDCALRSHSHANSDLGCGILPTEPPSFT